MILWHVHANIKWGPIRFENHRAEILDRDLALDEWVKSREDIGKTVFIGDMGGRPPWKRLPETSEHTVDAAHAANFRRNKLNAISAQFNRHRAAPVKEKNPEEQEWDRERETCLARSANNAGVTAPADDAPQKKGNATAKKTPYQNAIRAKRGLPLLKNPKEAGRGSDNDARKPSGRNPRGTRRAGS